MIAYLLVAGRIAASSWSAVAQKRLAQQGLSASLIFAATMWVLSAVALPGLWWFPLAGLPLVFWTSMTISAALDVPGNVLLARSFGLTDLSLAGPLSCYKPVLGLVLAYFMLGERPTVWGLAGAAVIVAGSLALKSGSASGPLAAIVALGRDPGLRARGLSLVMTTAAVVFSKRAIVISSVGQAFVAWTFLSALFATVLWAWLRRRELGEDGRLVRRSWAGLLGLAAVYVPLAWLSVVVLKLMFVGYALALFQLSAVLNVVLGWRVFGERDLVRRLGASAVMVAGAAILILGG